MANNQLYFNLYVHTYTYIYTYCITMLNVLLQDTEALQLIYRLKVLSLAGSHTTYRQGVASKDAKQETDSYTHIAPLMEKVLANLASELQVCIYHFVCIYLEQDMINKYHMGIKCMHVYIYTYTCRRIPYGGKVWRTDSF